MTWNVWNDLSANSTPLAALSTTLGFYLPPSLLIWKWFLMEVFSCFLPLASKLLALFPKSVLLSFSRSFLLSSLLQCDDQNPYVSFLEGKLQPGMSQLQSLFRILPPLIRMATHLSCCFWLLLWAACWCPSLCRDNFLEQQKLIISGIFNRAFPFSVSVLFSTSFFFFWLNLVSCHVS